MFNRIAGITVLAVATGCSGGGTLSTTSQSTVPTSGATATPAPGSSTAPTTGAAKSMTLAQNGAAPMQGIAGTFTLTATEYDVHGKLISGQYPQPITVTTNDSTDLQLSALPANGSPGGSATVLNSQTVVLVSYDGLSVPGGSQFAASANGLPAVTSAFAPLKASGGSSQVTTIAISQTGAPPYYGSPGQFALSISAYDSGGNPISGTYQTPIVLTTNDGKDLQMTTTQNSGGSSSVSVPNAQTTVFVSYDGAVVPNGTAFSAVSGSASQTVSFNPTNGSAPPPVISHIGLTRNGAKPIHAPGVFPVFVTAYDQNNVAINGALPNAINVSINETCDLSLSLGGSGSVIYCVPPPDENVGAVIINNANQVVFINYDGINPVPSDTAISATTLANVCTVISFPGNKPVTCPSPVPNSSQNRRALR